ncbi:kinase-like domain-containing protein [Gigaspora rosea]|uniref:Kinase-like domain-containing protein n=1 Tax=Gigaspora rosea TaxID=44941 RepID=A0A397TV65_9GLOM|nr:kinase-like domain-containing protein [Gigaspora rosea]
MCRYEESPIDLNKSLEINPNSVEALSTRGLAYFLTGRYEESFIDLNKSLEINPSSEVALPNRGFVYQCIGRYEESLIDLNELLIKSHRTNVQITPLRFGTCANCKQYNSGIDFCHLCDSQISQEWTSRNKEIDEFIKHAQMNTPYYHKIIEWIPFDRLENVQKIGKGGFSTIYSATWIDGKRAYSLDETKRKLIKTREKFCKVALKSLTGTQNVSLNFLNEFKAHYECQLEKLSVEKYGIETYGITYDTNRNEYMMVFEYADKGDLRRYLSENFTNLTWKQKLKLLYSISDNLDYIHQKYVHKDLHSGNILIVSTGSFDLYTLLYNVYIVNNKLIMLTPNIGVKTNIEPKISDLGLSSKINEIIVENGTYGVVQYVADEVLLGQPYTKASDIYSLGVIMSEVSTGKPPFKNLPCNMVQTQKVFNESRPEFAKGTPECYVELANQCMDRDPTKRPTAKEIYEKSRKWKITLDKETELNDDELKIKNAFLKADMIISQFETLQRHPDAKYTTQLEADEIISSQSGRDLGAIYTSQYIYFFP